MQPLCRNMIARNTIILVLLLVLRSSSAEHPLRRTVAGRSLGPIQDIFLDTLDQFTRPDDDDDDEEGVTTDVVTSAPNTLAPTDVPPPTSIPTTEPMAIVLSSDVPSTFPSDVVVSNTPSDIASNVPSVTQTTDIELLESVVPSNTPSDLPSAAPTMTSSSLPSTNPSDFPSTAPTMMPSSVPVIIPSDFPSTAPTMTPSDSPSMSPTNVPNIMPTSVPSDVPNASPSYVPSAMPSSVPSDTPSSLPSNTPSSMTSNVPSDTPTNLQSSIPSNVVSSVPSILQSVSPISKTSFSEDEIEIFEETCAQFLYDYLPLVQPNTYTDLACNVVNQTSSTRRGRQLQDDEVFVPFKIKDTEMLVAVTGDAPGETNFAQIVSQTFETFGTELHDSLRKTSDAFSEEEDDVVKPVGPEGEVNDVTSTSENGPTLEWTVLGISIVGGVCLALIVSLLLVKSRYRRHSDTTMPPETILEDLGEVKSKSFSVSSERDASSFREYSLIKLISIEASRSLAKNEEEEDDCLIMPPTPLGVETVPNSLMNSPEEIKSELSPASYTGEFGCCRNALQGIDTFDGPSSIIHHQDPNSSTVHDDVGDGNSTFMTGLSTAMMTNETATKMDRFSSSQSDTSDLEGLRLVVSNTNTFSNNDSTRAGPESQPTQPSEQFDAETQERRGFFSFRPSSFLKRRTVLRHSGVNIGDSMEADDCCATDNWTIRTNSILTPRKANTTTGNNSMKGQSCSF